MKSPKEMVLERKILSLLSEYGRDNPASKTAQLLMDDPEVQIMQDYANTVSIKRLGFNDHGPVHMRTVVLNAILMMNLLKKAGVKTSLEEEEIGSFSDSLVAVILASFLHDLGMTIGRQDHELHSVYLGLPVIDRVLAAVFHDDASRRFILRSLAIEGISGHMGTRAIHSLEAGVILVADGCDIQKGRARIPLSLGNEPRVGDIHKYSASSIEDVHIQAGGEKPISIMVEMSSEVGFFQIEEVLIAKLGRSTIKQYIELYAFVTGSPLKRYI